MEAYCVKCRKKQEMVGAQEVPMKNGRSALQGTCPVCGGKLFRLLGGVAGDGETKAPAKKKKPQQ